MMRHNQKRRAVSEVVGILLMLAVVVTTGVLIFTFASGGMTSLSESYAVAMSRQGSAAAERFVVEQASFNFSGAPTGADLYVRNVGTVSANLVSVYITDLTSDASVLQATISTTVNVGAFGDIPHTTLTFTPAHGHTYSFTVTSSLGNSATYRAEAT
jgi:flagellin-like protein